MLVRDLAGGATVKANVGTGDPASFSFSTASFSADGRRLAFDSTPVNQDVGDNTPRDSNVFVRDLAAGTTIRVSVDTAGDSRTDRASTPRSAPMDGWWRTSQEPDLVAGDGNGLRDVFVADLGLGSAREGLVELIDDIAGFGRRRESRTASRPRSAQPWLHSDRGAAAAACANLHALANHARAGSGKKLTPGQANQIISSVGRIRRASLSLTRGPLPAAAPVSPQAARNRRRARPHANRPTKAAENLPAVALTIGSGPFGQRPAGRFNFDPPVQAVLYVEESRAGCGGDSPARRSDSRRVKLVHQSGRLPSGTFRPRTSAPTCWWKRADALGAGPGRARAAEHRRGRAHGAGRGLAVARSDRLRVPRARRVARGRGGADRPPARPLPPHRRAAHVAASARLGRWRAGGGHSPVARAVRDRPAAALVHPARRRAGVALPSAHTTVCAYKGTASHWSAAGEEAIVELRGAVRRSPGDPGAGRLLRRARGPGDRRRGARAPRTQWSRPTRQRPSVNGNPARLHTQGSARSRRRRQDSAPAATTTSSPRRSTIRRSQHAADRH